MISKSSTAMTSDLSETLLPPPPSSFFSNKAITIFWCVVSAASTLACMASLTTMKCFNSLTHPYTNPTIILFSALSVSLHLGLFFNLDNIPTLNNVILALITAFVEAAGFFIRFMSMVHPREDSVEVVVFFTAVAIDVMAILKLVKPRRDGHVFDHVVFVAMIRVCRMCFNLGLKEYWYVFGALGALVAYNDFSTALLKRRIRLGVN